MNYVDLHSHLLPALDDGPGTFADSVALIEAAWKGGTRRMVATPHMFHGGVGSDDRDEVVERFVDFETRLAAHVAERRTQPAGTAGNEQEGEAAYLAGLELALGAENYVGEAFLGALATKRILTLGGSHYLLMEFWPMVTATTARQAIDAVQEQGFVPVLAHVERYAFLQNEPGRLADLVAAGSAAQVNASAILGHQGLRLAEVADRWLRRGLIAVVASDGHDIRTRRPQLTEVADHLRARHGGACEDHCLRLNPTAILADEPIGLPPARRSRWWLGGR